MTPNNYFDSNILTAPLPFFRKEKMEQLLEELKKQVKNNTEDFMKACGYRIRTPDSVMAVFESQFSSLHNGCLYLKTEHERLVKELFHCEYNYLQLVALSADKEMLETIGERQLMQQQMKTGTTAEQYWAQQELLLPKELNYWEQQKKRNHFIVEHAKSQDYKNLSLSKTIHSQNEYDKYKELKEHSKDDPFTTDVKSVQLDGTTVIYPEMPAYETTETPNGSNTQETRQAPAPQKAAIKEDSTPVFNPPLYYLQYSVGFSEAPVSYPDYLKGELSLLNSMHIFGDNFARVYFPNEAPENALALEEELDKEHELPKIKTNILGSASFMKLLLCWLAVIAGSLTEYFVYTAVLGGIFGFEGAKYWVAGLIVLPLSKVIGFSLWSTVKRFIQQANRLSWRRLKNSRFFYMLIAAALLYTLCLGVLYFDILQQKKYTREYVLLQEQLQAEKEEQHWNTDSTAVPQKINETTTDGQNTERRLREAEEKVFRHNSFITILKAFTVGLSSSIILLINAVLLNISLLFLQAFAAKRRISALSKLVAQKKKRFYAQKQSIATLRLKAFSIYKIYGHIRFVKSILAGGTPKDAMGGSFTHTPRYENLIVPAPSNGKPKEPLKL